MSYSTFVISFSTFYLILVPECKIERERERGRSSQEAIYLGACIRKRWLEAKAVTKECYNKSLSTWVFIKHSSLRFYRSNSTSSECRIPGELSTQTKHITSIVYYPHTSASPRQSNRLKSENKQNALYRSTGHANEWTPRIMNYKWHIDIHWPCIKMRPSL